MKLNLNFNGLTKLRDWWNVVLSNFKIIEKECTKTREIADNACTKEEAKSYINEFIGLSDDYMAAIEAFTELYEKNSNSVSAMEEVFGGRLKYYSKEEAFDVNEAVGEDAIYFCKDKTINTPDCGKGMIISSADGCQRWMNKDGILYLRQLSENIWSEWSSNNEERLKTNEERVETIDKKLGNKAETLLKTVQVLNTDWTMQDDMYTQTVACDGLLSSDYPIVDICTNDSRADNKLFIEAWSCVMRVVANDNSITIFTDGTLPNVTFSMNIKVVR